MRCPRQTRVARDNETVTAIVTSAFDVIACSACNRTEYFGINTSALDEPEPHLPLAPFSSVDDATPSEHNMLNNDSVSISRATSRASSKHGSSVSRQQSLIKKNIAPHDLRPSDILIERFTAWKIIVKQLIAYFEVSGEV